MKSSKPETTKKEHEFRVLIVYPNLPLMLLVPVAVGLFTRILRDKGYIVDLFDTTYYDEDGKTSYGEERTNKLQAREFDVAKGLKISLGSDALADFRQKVKTFKPNLILGTVVEDSVFKMLGLLRAIRAFVMCASTGPT